MTSERLCPGQPSARTPRTAPQNAGCGLSPQKAPGGVCAVAQRPPKQRINNWAAMIVWVFSMAALIFSRGELRRPQILQYPADPGHVVLVRLIPQRFLERVGVPFSHGTSIQQEMGIGLGRG